MGDLAPWLERAKQLLQDYASNRGPEIVPSTVSLLTAVYGPSSTQLDSFNISMARIAKQVSSARDCQFYQSEHAYAVVNSVIAEMKGGLTGSIRAQVAGEMLSELVGLGKEILSDSTESAKNVGAVLIAAAYEDLMRRMGSELAGVVGRPRLDEVLTALKSANILKGGEIGVAQSYLKFRNDSLHADWSNIQRSQVESCVAFIEALLLKHFS